MLRNASRALKIGVHLPFDPNIGVGMGTFYPEKFRQTSYISLLYGYSMILLYNHSLILLYKIDQTKLSLLY